MGAFAQAMKTGAIAATAAAFLLGIPSAADAQSTGTVRLKVTGVGFIIGGGGGTGTLTFRGKTYPLRVSGLSAGTIGVSSADMVGTASNLRNAQDIVGTYSAAGAGLAVAGGGRAIQMQNSRGVVLNLQGRQAGFQASLGVGGVEISMR